MNQDGVMRCDELKPDYMLYAIGAMDEPERDEIRAHLDSGCKDCAERLREARALAYSMGALIDGPEPPKELRRRVLAIAAAPERSGSPAPLSAPKRPPFWTRPILAWQGLALAAACLAVAFVPAVLWRRAATEYDTRQAVSAAALAREQSTAAELRDQLAKLEAPSLRANPIVTLEPERGAGGEAVRQVSIPASATAVVLALPSDLVRQASAADLRDASGQIIRSISPLQAPGADAVGVTIDTQLLSAGRYSLTLRAGERTVARFAFVVSPR